MNDSNSYQDPSKKTLSVNNDLSMANHLKGVSCRIPAVAPI